MSRNNLAGIARWRGAVLLCVPVALLAAASDSPPLLEAHPTPRLLFPANYVAVETGAFELIAVAAAQQEGAPKTLTLEVDGQAGSWEAYEPPVHVSRLELAPGKHTLTLGGIDVVVFVAGSEGKAVENRPVFKSHPNVAGPWKKCELCHDLADKDGRQVLGAYRGCTACEKCHEPKDIAIGHAHVEEPLRECQTCHAVHGSPRPVLLSAPAKELCTRCHD